jgi:hypothetical protein
VSSRQTLYAGIEKLRMHASTPAKLMVGGPYTANKNAHAHHNVRILLAARTVRSAAVTTTSTKCRGGLVLRHGPRKPLAWPTVGVCPEMPGFTSRASSHGSSQGQTIGALRACSSLTPMAYPAPLLCSRPAFHMRESHAGYRYQCRSAAGSKAAHKLHRGHRHWAEAVEHQGACTTRSAAVWSGLRTE